MLLQVQSHMQHVKDTGYISEQAAPQTTLSLLVHFLQDVMDCKYLRQDKTLLKSFLTALNTEDQSVGCGDVYVHFAIYIYDKTSMFNLSIYPYHCYKYFMMTADITSG